MRQFSHNLRGRSWQTVAGVIAVLCLWMGTGGVLHHTDVDTAVFLVGQAAVHHATPAAQVDPCAACEWTQGLQTHLLSLPQLVVLLDSLPPYQVPFVPPAPARAARRASPRAPPYFLV